MTNASKEPNITDEARQGPPHENGTRAHSLKEMLPLLASIAGLVCAGFASGSCHFLKRDFYVVPQDYVLCGGGCEECFTVEECRQCYENPACELVFPRTRAVPEDCRKETQGIGFWSMERFTGCGSWNLERFTGCGPGDGVKEVSGSPSCQNWPQDAVDDFDGFWLYGRIMSLTTIFIGMLAVVVLLFHIACGGNVAKPFLVGLHVAVGVFTVLLLIAIKSDLCSDSALVPVEFESGEEESVIHEFPVAGCHAGIGQKVAIGSFCCWVLGAIGILVAYKDPNEPSILEKWAKITAASAGATKQTSVVPHPEEEKEDMASASIPIEPITEQS